MIPAASILIVTTELVTAISLLFLEVEYGVILGIGLLLVYASAIFLNLARGRTWMDCGCLGSKGEGLSYWLVARNLSLLGALMIVLLPTLDRNLVWLDYFSIVFFGLAMAVTYVVMNTLLAANTRSKMWWS
jgi:hypothetical protein